MPYALLNGRAIQIAELRFCSDCRHIRPEEMVRPEEWYCRHPGVTAPDIVSGMSWHRHGEAREAREEGAACGPDGKLWEPQPVNSRTTTPET